MAADRPRTTRGRRTPRAALAVALVAFLSAAATAVGLGAAGSFTKPRHPRQAAATQLSTSRATSRPPIGRLVGQMLMGRMYGTTPDESLLRRIRLGKLGGVILFSDNIGSNAQLRAVIAQLQAAAKRGGNPPLLVATDQEGGTVERFPDGPPGLSAKQMAATRDAPAVFGMGRDTGRYLRALGINVDLAPVLDVPSSPDNFLGSRAFASRPSVVGRYGKAFLEGVQAAGVAATAKHFPGLGTAGGNTDLSRIVITTPESGLRWRYRSFGIAVRAGVRMVMVSNASYRALDPSGRPAGLSRPIVTGLLRERLGFAGVVITDAFGTPGPSSYADAPAQAVAAGVDVLLYSDGEQTSAAAYRSLVGAVRSGALRRAQLEAANARIAALKGWLARP